jgi:hypothetical protein
MENRRDICKKVFAVIRSVRYAFRKGVSDMAMRNGTRRSSMAGRLILSLGLSALFATGCYEVSQEVILASEAVAVNGLPGSYTKDDQQTRETISAIPFSNDYRFQRFESPDEKKPTSGYLRAVPLRDNIYIVQIKNDDEPGYVLDFYRFSLGEGYRHLKPNEDQAKQLARQFGVELLWDDSFGEHQLNGSRENILRFLYAHRGVDLQ